MIYSVQHSHIFNAGRCNMFKLISRIIFYNSEINKARSPALKYMRGRWLSCEKTFKNVLILLEY